METWLFYIKVWLGILGLIFIFYIYTNIKWFFVKNEKIIKIALKHSFLKNFIDFE